MKVFGVIITYHPDAARLEACLSAVRPQVDEVVLLDNSRENRGVAAALNEGMRRASEAGADFVLSLDQDSILPPDAVHKMLAYASVHPEVAQIGPRWSEEPAGCRDVAHLITSGSLLRLSAWREAGPFREAYFIDAVDIEYSCRLRARGCRVVCCGDVVLDHRLGDGLQGWDILGKKRLGYIGHPPLRIYYMLRNALYFAAEYRTAEARQYLRRVRRTIRRMLLQSPERAAVWQYACRARKDYRAGVTGAFIGNP